MNAVNNTSTRRWRKRLLIGAIAIAIFGTAAWYAYNYTWLPEGTSTISLFRAEEAFHQCSRDVPVTDGIYWTPTAEEIAEVENGLWYLLEQREYQKKPNPRRFMPYHRQYIGFTRHGERLIYVNIAPNLPEDSWRRWSPTERPYAGCDGGNAYWGIVYNPKRREFEEPSFNGPG